MTQQISPPRCLSGNDVRGIMDQHGLSYADLSRLSGYTQSVMYEHIAVGSKPLRLRISNTYRGVIAHLDKQSDAV